MGPMDHNSGKCAVGKLVKEPYMRIWIALVVIVLAGASAGRASGQTIAEAARARPGQPVVRGVLREIQPVSADQLAREADLVIEGTLVKTRTYLTPDEQYVLTDFKIVPNRVIAGQLDQ